MILTTMIVLLAGLLFPTLSWASEADLIIPNLNSVTFFNVGGHTLLLGGMVICLFGFVFGLVQFLDIKNMK